jgi:hypothetical protein
MGEFQKVNGRYAASRVLFPDSSWVNSVFVVPGDGFAALAWTTKDHTSTAYFWIGDIRTVEEDFDTLHEIDRSGGSVGQGLLEIGNEYTVKEKVEDFEFEFLETTAPEKLQTGGFVNKSTASDIWNSYVTYTWPHKFEWKQPTLFASLGPDGIDSDVALAIKMFVRALPQEYRDVIKEAL